MGPTTIGKGPFKPAIEFNDELYVYDFDFGTDHEAYSRAHAIYELVCKELITKLRGKGFELKKRVR